MQSKLLPSTINSEEKGTSPGTESGSGWSRFPVNLRFVDGKKLDLVVDLDIVRPLWPKIMKPLLPLPKLHWSPSVPSLLLPFIHQFIHAE